MQVLSDAHCSCMKRLAGVSRKPVLALTHYKPRGFKSTGRLGKALGFQFFADQQKELVLQLNQARYVGKILDMTLTMRPGALLLVRVPCLTSLMFLLLPPQLPSQPLLLALRMQNL